MEILSYYRRGSVEPLRRHVELGLEFCRVREGSRVLRTAQSWGFRGEELEELTSLCVVFHDSGKVFFQERQLNKFERLSFRGHEFFSTYLFEEFRQELIDRSLEEPQEHLACEFGVLYHHHAMNRELRAPKLSKTTVPLWYQRFKLGVELIEDLKRILGVGLRSKDQRKAMEASLDRVRDKFQSRLELVPEVEVKMLKPTHTVRSSLELVPEVEDSQVIGGLVGEIVREVGGISRKIWRKFVEDPKLRKLGFLLLSVLMAVDYLAAQELRGATPSDFAQALREFWELYLS